MALITVAELITITNFSLSGDYDESYLESKINTISAHVEAYCLGTLFSPQEIADERNRSYVQGRTGDLTIRLRYAPLISVDGIKYRVGSTDTALTIDTADLDLVNARVYLTWYGPLWRVKEKWVTVTTYTAGHATVPDLVKEATALLVREAIDAEDQANSGSGGGTLVSYRIGNYEERYSTAAAETGNLGLGTQRSLLAGQYLKKYRRIGVK